MTLGAQFVLALLLDAVFGEPKWIWSRVPHPAVLIGRLIASLDRALNTPPLARLKGALALMMIMAVAGTTGWAVAQLGPFAEALAAAVLLAHKSLVDHVRSVARALRISLGDGRRSVAMIVGRDVSTTSAPGVARASLESLAENFSDGVVAPAFWFLIGGLPAMAVYKAVNTADSMIGYRTPRYEAFGWASARLDDVLNWIPARLTAWIIAFVGYGFAFWPRIATDARLHRSPNAGWPEAALAHSQDIALAGPRSYHGALQEFAWVNPTGEREIGPSEIDAGIALIWKSWSVLLATGGLIWIVGLFF